MGGGCCSVVASTIESDQPINYTTHTGGSAPQQVLRPGTAPENPAGAGDGAEPHLPAVRTYPNKYIILLLYNIYIHIKGSAPSPHPKETASTHPLTHQPTTHMHTHKTNPSTTASTPSASRPRPCSRRCGPRTAPCTRRGGTGCSSPRPPLPVPTKTAYHQEQQQPPLRSREEKGGHQHEHQHQHQSRTSTRPRPSPTTPSSSPPSARRVELGWGSAACTPARTWWWWTGAFVLLRLGVCESMMG